MGSERGIIPRKKESEIKLPMKISYTNKRKQQPVRKMEKKYENWRHFLNIKMMRDEK